MTIGEGKIVRGDGVESIVRITQFTYSLINEFPNKRTSNIEQGMAIGEGEVVRGDGGEIYCPNYPIHLFSNKRITCFSGHPGHNRFFIRSRSKFYHQKNSGRLLIQNDRACIVLMGGF